MTSRKQTPSDFLKQIIGRPVVVKLNSGIGKYVYSTIHIYIYSIRLITRFMIYFNKNNVSLLNRFWFIIMIYYCIISNFSLVIRKSVINQTKLTKRLNMHQSYINISFHTIDRYL